MEQKSNSRKVIKMKEIMRLFFKYDIEVLPVVDGRDKFKGFINKNLIIQNATDSGFIDKLFPKLISKYLTYPNEKEFLLLVSRLSDDNNFPVIDNKGNYLFLWFKKDLLNHYYNISLNEGKNQTQKDDMFKGIVKCLPLNIVLTETTGKIIFINDNFLSEFDFEEDILIKQNINKFFPKINKIFIDSNLYPKIHSFLYRHVNWYYVIIKYKSVYVYMFSLYKEKLLTHDKDNIFSIDKPEIKEKTKKIIKVETTKIKPLPDIIENQEKDILIKTLNESDWNITHAAKILEIPRQTLQYKISKYKIV